MDGFRSLTVPLGTRVRVYRNLHRRCYSVVAAGRIVGHAFDLVLEDAAFHVGAAGRARVLATQQKNVHAWIRGRLAAADVTPRADAVRVRYDPYAHATFVTADGTPVRGARRVTMTTIGVFAEGAA